MYKMGLRREGGSKNPSLGQTPIIHTYIHKNSLKTCSESKIRIIYGVLQNNLYASRPFFLPQHLRSAPQPVIVAALDPEISLTVNLPSGMEKKMNIINFKIITLESEGRIETRAWRRIKIRSLRQVQKSFSKKFLTL